MIYLASSWRNPWYDTTLKDLKDLMYDVYDFKADGFTWSTISDVEEVSPTAVSKILQHPAAVDHWEKDMDALTRATTLVLLLPCGNSAHTELGIAMATHKRVIILSYSDMRLDLMYTGAEFVDTFTELVKALS